MAEASQQAGGDVGRAAGVLDARQQQLLQGLLQLLLFAGQRLVMKDSENLRVDRRPDSDQDSPVVLFWLLDSVDPLVDSLCSGRTGRTPAPPRSSAAAL